MHTHSSRVLVVILVMLAGTIVSADRVRLRSGKVVEGTFTGADSTTVRLLLANGSRAEFPVADVAGVEFTAHASAAAAAAAALAGARAGAGHRAGKDDGQCPAHRSD